MALESVSQGQTIQISCTDVFDRQRAVSLWAGRGRRRVPEVVLVAPAGEAARLTPEQARVLAGQLVVHADRVDAQRRAAGRPTRARVLPLPVRGRVTP